MKSEVKTPGIALGGLLRAEGALGAKAQVIIRKYCERGMIQPMMEAVADYLLGSGMASGRIPQNAGLKTKELADRAAAAISTVVEDYRAGGGVLVAKSYVSALGLEAEMAKQWLNTFAPPLPMTKKLTQGLDEEEINARLTLVALHLNDLLTPKEDGPTTWLHYMECGNGPPKDLIILDPDSLEGLCRRAAVEMLRVFDDPNAENHRILHKETPHGGS